MLEGDGPSARLATAQEASNRASGAEPSPQPGDSGTTTGNDAEERGSNVEERGSRGMPWGGKNKGTVSIASWNIRNGRQCGLDAAVKGLEQCGAALAVLQETKRTDGKYPRRIGEYRVICTDAPSAHQGGGGARVG